MADKVAIVTGASSGIGQATAVELAGRGYAVVLAARRAPQLAEVAQQCRSAGAPAALAVPTDVANWDQVKALVDTAVKEFGRVDVMLNNAGYGVYALAWETTEEDMRGIFDVNFFGVFYGCKAVSPVMIRQGSGHIFNVSSVLGKRGSPFHGAYSATKFAINGFDDSLRVELAQHNVRVTTVCPALTQTEFFQHSRRGQAAKSSFQKFKSMSPPALVARKIVGAIGKNKPEIVITAGGKFLALASALSPRLGDLLMTIYLKDLTRKLRKVDAD